MSEKLAKVRFSVIGVVISVQLSVICYVIILNELQENTKNQLVQKLLKLAQPKPYRYSINSDEWKFKDHNLARSS